MKNLKAKANLRLFPMFVDIVLAILNIEIKNVFKPIIEILYQSEKDPNFFYRETKKNLNS